MSLHLALFPPLYLYRLITSVAVLSHVVCFPKGYTHTRARGRIWCHFGFLFPRSLDESNRKNRSKMKGRTSTSSSFPPSILFKNHRVFFIPPNCQLWRNAVAKPPQPTLPCEWKLTRERERKEKRTTSYISKMLGSRGANKRLCTRDTHMVRKWEYTWQGKKTDGLLRSFVIEGVLKEKVSLSLVPPDRVPWRETNARWLVSWRSV